MPRGKDKKNRSQAVEPNKEFLQKRFERLSENLMRWHEEELVGYKKGHYAHIVPRGLKYFKECIDAGVMPTASFLYQEIGYPYDQISMLCGCLSSGYAKKTKEKVGYALKMMQGFIAANYEMDGTQKINPSFGIFMLKNLGMEDRHVVDDTESFSKTERDEIREKLKRL